MSLSLRALGEQVLVSRNLNLRCGEPREDRSQARARSMIKATSAALLVGTLGLRNKITLITNCSGLQGPALAAEFQQQGATLYLQDLDIEKAKPILAKSGLNLEGDVHFVQADFSERGDAEREISDIVAETGRLDILVNNSFHEHLDKPLLGIDEDEWDSMQRTLLTETFYATKAALKHMISARDGKILTVTSTSGLDGYLDKPCCHAATAGAVSFMRALSREVAPYNIQVNVIGESGAEQTACCKDERLSK